MRELFKKHVIHRFLPKEAGTGKKIAVWAISIFIAFFLFGLIVFASTIAILSIGLPNVSEIENLTAAQSTEIFDRDGKLLYTIHGEENREQVDIKNISHYVVDATVAFEDTSFYEHSGFDIWALGKVGLYEIFGIGRPRGGSTITQQYVKNSFLSPERSYIRKAKELILSLRVERAFNKDQIMELYLNRIPYGNNAYGIQKAAEIYFNKEAKDLTLGESALLVALPQAPSRYNPFGENRYSHLLKDFTVDELKKRKIKTEYDLKTDEYARGLIGQHVKLPDGNTVYIAGRSDVILKRMFETEKITAEERKTALNEIQKVTFNDYHEKIRAPHFVMYIKLLLEEKYGKDTVERGGLKVTTTINGDLQDFAEKTAFEMGESNEKRFDANNVSVVTINAKTGEILTMVGSRDYFNEEIDGNVNVSLRPRQPGSSFKPIVYAQSFYNGYGPGSVIYDIPTRFGTDTPQDFDGGWKGQMTIRSALGQSRNIPAIMAYFLAGEQDTIIDLASRMGITTLDKKHDYGYPLALGAGEVPLIEMVRAYGVFANNGKKPELTGILKVENSNGDILEEWKPPVLEEVLDPQIAYLINSILSDQRYGVGPRLYIKGKVNAAKTGTSTDKNKKSGNVRPKDGWTIGYTPTIVTGVWIGNTDGKAMNYNADGYDSGAPIFNAVMTKALEDIPAEPFPEPKGITHVKISKASGKLPGPNTPPSMITEEVFASFAVPTVTESLFYKVKVDKISGLLATEYTPEDAIKEVTYQNYEPIADKFNWAQEIKNYYHGKSGSEEGIEVGAPPTEYDNIHTAETAKKKPSINIISPSPNTTVGIGNTQVMVDLVAQNQVEIVEFYVDNDKKFFSTTPPYTGFVNISRFLTPGTNHLIVAKVIDKLGYSAQSAIEIKVEDTSTSSVGVTE